MIDEAKLAAFFDEAMPLLPIALRQTKLRTPTAGRPALATNWPRVRR
jgi:hypothetical protein